jgi:NitT/TauT family transport system permease protein
MTDISTVHPLPPTRLSPPVRPEYERTHEPPATPVNEETLSLTRRLWQLDGLRRGLILVALALLWEIVGRLQGNPLLLPSFTATMRAFFEDISNGLIPGRAMNSLDVLIKGYIAGVALAFILTSVAVSTRIGRDLLSTLTSTLNPLPPIALLPLALLWFGLGQGSLVFVLIHSVLWPLALNMYTGFTSVPETLRMTGRNYGLKGLRYVFLILVPAALPSIIAGIKIGWAFAWRTLIAAELVFGASSGRGGLGWYIFQNRNELYTDRVFAGLITVIALGFLVENVLFRQLEQQTVLKWGTTR